MKLLCDDDGHLMKHLFYDNVRDYQGNNEVNTEIAETLSDAAQRDKFAVLNNGMTVVAKAMNRVASHLRLGNIRSSTDAKQAMSFITILMRWEKMFTYPLS